MEGTETLILMWGCRYQVLFIIACVYYVLTPEKMHYFNNLILTFCVWKAENCLYEDSLSDHFKFYENELFSTIFR